MILLQARSITFSYGRTPDILTGWDQAFESGEVVAITGPSGCGKSTLLYLLGLMLKPTEGNVVVDGFDAAHLSDSRRAHLRATMFGFVFQDAALDMGRTVLDNVLETALYRGESRRDASFRALELMEQFGVAMRATHRPGEVSGGQAQRIALARALLNHPRILLADEPTGNLDPVSAGIVVQALRDRASCGAAVIVATHDPALVEQCDRIVRL
ncbi:ATP-binding cassette domain-containing protein [Cryobacterium sp. PH31-AA6]|uniref:ABC transporter ATP-binding protein n=1 Tax=Cryobacterium sp. PH31-AA6 TaxID=3046205 RepID=UPI0024BBD727|nr:ATP-binding cassette domain-containing protein [Cryobacterium sp. PH31-AA6]MDJ0325505.1 ATP-binding cassette domain-containing protein [Cryobacterium sp. PH31-AA6]